MKVSKSISRNVDKSSKETKKKKREDKHPKIKIKTMNKQTQKAQPQKVPHTCANKAEVYS